MAVILIGGGSRSGKSRYALEKALEVDGTRAFIATAQAFDEEMAARIQRHREDRDKGFATIEEPIELARTVAKASFDVVVVDCLTLWLSNIMLANADCDRKIEELIETSQSATKTVIYVTNEVGSGIVPDNALARDFRDRAGFLNQCVASIAQEVYLMVFGQPLRVK